MRRLSLTLVIALTGFADVFAAGPCTAFAARASVARSKSGAQLGLRRVLSRDIGAAGRSSGAYVLDLTTGQPLYAAAAGAGRLPASVQKLYTTATALLRFGPQFALQTTVLGTGTVGPGGAWRGTLYLKGGGDPTFGSESFDRSTYGTGATVQRLVASLLRATHVKSIRGEIVGDESDLDSLRGTPYSGYQPSGYTEGLLSGLAYDRGFVDEQQTAFQSHPALFAAQQFAAALRSAGVRLSSSEVVRSGVSPSRAKPLAAVSSPPLGTLISLTNTPSDNYLAEMLLKDIGARFGAGGSTAAGAAVVRAELASSFGIHPRLDDGSGLSRLDSTSPREVVSALARMAGDRYFVQSLALAGETGTLRYEMQGTRAQGRCAGKTGTLHDVASLAGYCRASNGHTLAFAFLMNAIDPSYGHSLEAQMAVALARYNG